MALKVLPIKKEEKMYVPRFDIEVTIGYGEHCCDTFTTHRKTIDDDKAKTDSWNHISQLDAEKIVKLLKRALEDVDDGHIVLNDGITDFWCQGMKSNDIQELRSIYEKHQYLFEPDIEHNWYGIVGACIKYLDAEGNWHDVEIV